MSADVFPPNPSLVAILLVVKTRSEPRLVFHYPPKPGEDNARYQHIFKEATRADTSTSSDETETSEDEPAPIEDLSTAQKSDSPPYADEVGSVSPEKKDGFPEKVADTQWNDLFSYRAGMLAKLLCPAKNHDKRRMELGLDGKVFLGQPVFVGSNGEWRRRKPRRTSSKSTAQPSDFRASLHMEGISDREKDENPISDNIDSQSNDNVTDERDDYDDAQIVEKSTEVWDGATHTVSRQEKKPKAPLQMFQVSFVLNPPQLEHHLRVKEMYDNVTKKFTKALRWEQGRSDYVAREASTIISAIKQLHKSSGKAVRVLGLQYELT